MAIFFRPTAAGIYNENDKNLGYFLAPSCVGLQNA